MKKSKRVYVRRNTAKQVAALREAELRLERSRVADLTNELRSADAQSRRWQEMVDDRDAEIRHLSELVARLARNWQLRERP